MPMAISSPVLLSTTPIPISGKRLYWRHSSPRCLWPTMIINPSTATISAPVPCWRIQRPWPAWFVNPVPTPRICSPLRAQTTCVVRHCDQINETAEPNCTTVDSVVFAYPTQIRRRKVYGSNDTSNQSEPVAPAHNGGFLHICPKLYRKTIALFDGNQYDFDWGLLNCRLES